MLAPRLTPDISRRDAKTSRAISSEKIKTPTSLYSAIRIQHPASRIPHPASRIPHPASRIPHPASRIPHPASRTSQYASASVT
jgi:hypothetical protein